MSNNAGVRVIIWSGAHWDSLLYFSHAKQVACSGTWVFVGCHTTIQVSYQITAFTPQSERASSVTSQCVFHANCGI